MMPEQKDNAAAKMRRGFYHWPGFKRYLVAGVASAALLAAAPQIHRVRGESSILSQNQSPGSLSLEHKAVPLPDFTGLVQQVKPAVVSVRVKTLGTSEFMLGEAPDFGEGPDGNPFKGTPFEKFFKNFKNHGDGWRRLEPKRHPVEALGSGFFISPDGYIVTNNHVVQDAQEVTVVTDAGDKLKAKVIGTDKKTDLALLKVEDGKKFPFLTLAKEQPQIGQWVLAMGNPFGLGGTVTQGIVSAMGRDIGEGPYDNFIQIDAAVNRGNSGGPTFNMKGEVLGVNTAIFSPTGGNVGIAFDIPAATVAEVIPQLETRGYVQRGWLGVQIQPVTQSIADSLGLKEARGALISQPQPGSPAAKAGLKSGDVITAVNDTQIKDARELARTVANIAPGTDVTLHIVRNGQPEDVKVTIAQLKEKKAEPTAHEIAPQEKHQENLGDLGLTLVPSSDLPGAGQHGVAIVNVDPNGAAADLGLAPGDIILKAGGKPVSTPNDLRQALKEAKQNGRGHALLLVKHNDSEVYVAMPTAVG